jgi:2Fe-2S ferredoxin
MPKIIYREHDGTEHALEVESGLSVMEGALNAGVPGILAECGGSAACATCQIMVDEDWVGRVPPPAVLEESMLDEEDIAINLRLSCQIAVTPEVDGLIVHIPRKQR